MGSYAFRHVRAEWFQDWGSLEVGDEQQAFVALPEKAVLDLIYLEPGADSHAYLKELRLQNLEALDLDRLQQQAELTSSPKLQRGAARVAALVRSERTEYGIL